MNRGYVKLWRKSLDAGWIKNLKLWVFWTYCLLKASHKEYDAVVGLQVVHLLPGEFIFGLNIASNETSLTIRQIRTALTFLKKSGNLTIKTTNKFSIITIINWNSYQSGGSKDDMQNDIPLANKEQHTNTIKRKNIKTPAEILSQISRLVNRYPDQETINKAFQAISSTRKSNRIADTIKLSILQAWKRYPVESVMAGIKTYLEKRYHLQGKKEAYLLGIIRNVKSSEVDMTEGKVMKSTGSYTLDEHYRSQGVRII